jgi:hypothetical protein
MSLSNVKFLNISRADIRSCAQELLFTLVFVAALLFSVWFSVWAAQTLMGKM